MARGKFNGALHPRNKDGEFARKASGSKSFGGKSKGELKGNVNYVPKNRVPTGQHKGPNVQARSGVKTSATKTRADLHNKQPQYTKRLTRGEQIGKSTRTGLKTGVVVGLGVGVLGASLAVAQGYRPNALTIAGGVSKNIVSYGLAGGAIGAVVGGFKKTGTKRVSAKAALSGKRV